MKYPPVMLNNYNKNIDLLFVRFYAVGLLLFMIPYTRQFFISITTLSLLLVIGAVFYFHKRWDGRTVLWFLFIIVSSFTLEMTGTETGEIFGEYYYGRGLAPLVKQTPLIIGLNWLFLTYSSHEITAKLFHRRWQRTVGGAVLMIIYDLVLEWVAPVMQMWHFPSGYPPFRNFAVWFLVSLLYLSGFEMLKIRSNNHIARFVFFSQIVFFIIIGIYSSLFIR